uniref:NADH dehydrogenase subunit 3 n=1 Tax=Pseudoceramium tenerrimum TaxID=196911 RepID=UPI002E778203|nr:NADH dehydrogenase subunit 3 [Pseudoceramium tenerrimum]YP_011017850.1 NADH dehydrogenase subunit 3 [Pseudoceramium tenerrimum]WQF69715.1 NADH dehydrogenase subunit 3 [Pseudoceramium tenerrimum]WQF69726.1 NADH dehydrogenase subunit 3 [Pseudoceramium tenerrimum]WQF69751.1 NADH dehydrogenase subunit 3 [Pseudoceramium tenerrimum]WQF69762.1 NADH dehydrogenase subunit 3 [Pseudoceramium tenerrimum]
MKLLFSEYFTILLFFSLAVLLSSILFFLSLILVPKKFDQEKVSAYECGFNPFDDARSTFDIRFYLVAILFLIFDLEISFLFPWTLVLNSISLLTYWSMVIFLVILTVGFIYEWKKGALEWE